MSGAVLAWGIDLGHEDSVAAKLFEGHIREDEAWGSYEYGSNRKALLLERSAVWREDDDEDYSVTGFIEVVLGGSGFPELKSQPTSDEIDDLKEIVTKVRPDPAVAEMVLQLLLLPLD